ncbi:acetyl-CoA carboxylase biotin carboxyl carrier protein [Nonomuraea rubra]
MSAHEAAGRAADPTAREGTAPAADLEGAGPAGDAAAQETAGRAGNAAAQETAGRVGDVSSQALMGELCRQAAELIAVGGRMRRVRLQAGDAVVELEWPDVTAGPPVTAAGAPPAAALPATAASPATAAWPGAAAFPDAASYAAPHAGSGAGPGAVPANGASADAAGTPAAGAGGDDLRHVCAPMVGTFYWASEPGAEPFVAVGDTVEKGQQVGIVEAMKLMNPIEADVSGRVVEVLVPDGTPVEYGQKLIAVAPPATP